MTTALRCLVPVLALLAALPAGAELVLPRFLSKGMVLQRQKPIVIWGKDAPGTDITVAFGGLGAKTKADAKGGWKVSLPAMEADAKPGTLTVSGTTTVVLGDILVGEVWLASGQSNMDWRLSVSKDGPKEAAAAEFPEIRLFRVEKEFSPKRKSDVATGEWKPCSPKTAGGFSGVAYFFGKEIHRELKVPVGLIMSAVPGTPIEPWMAPESLPEVFTPAEIEAKKKYPPAGQLYEGMIRPLAPLPIRGVIWYQGEGNSKDGALYAGKMKAMVGGWRKAWSDAFPFYFVQIGQRQYGKPEENDTTTLPLSWEAQTEAARLIPDSGMAVINDASDLDLHPRDKRTPGERLARLALAKTYGRRDLVYSGPVFRSMAIEGNRIRLKFDHVGTGLVSRDGKELSWFEIVDQNAGGFVPAKASIDGREIVVSATGVTKPVAVRFAWNNVALPNLMNKEGLPAASFRAGDAPER